MNILTIFSIGQYVDGNKSWLRIIDSRLKIIAALIFLITPIWAGPFWRLSLVLCLFIITFLSLLPYRVWWRSIIFLTSLSLIIGFLSILASSDIQSLESSLRDPNELSLILESKSNWNIIEIPVNGLEKFWEEYLTLEKMRTLTLSKHKCDSRFKVACNIDSGSTIDRNCFGIRSLDRGHNLLPEPPARIITFNIKVFPRLLLERL